MELNQPASQTIAVEAKYNLSNDQEVGMRELRKLRAEAWDQNWPFRDQFDDGPRTVREAAAARGFTTKEQYVNAVQLDYGYAIIALQRAVEHAANYSGKKAHVRPFNSTCYGNCGQEDTATIGGKGGYGQNLHGYADMNASMQGWGFGEVNALKRLGGEWSSDRRNLTGHVHTFLNPRVTRIGFAGVQTAEGNAAAATAGWDATTVTSIPQGARTEVLYRPANTGESPSATPKKMSLAQKNSTGAPDTGIIPAVGSIDEETARILSIVVSVISIISFLAGVAQQFNLLPF
mgnify:CR=1 FL=1